MPIPKILHFIWVGVRPISDAGLYNIKKWMEINPEFQVFLWVDREATPTSVFDKYATQAKYFSEEINDKRLALMDITENAVISPEARYEIDRLRPNYGAASDLLRYRILHRYGGAYYDCDIVPTIGYHRIVWLPENAALTQREVGTLYLQKKQEGIAVYALNSADRAVSQQADIEALLAIKRETARAATEDKRTVEKVVALCGYTQNQVNLSTVDYLWQGDHHGFVRIASPALMMCNNDCFFSEANSEVAQRIAHHTHANYTKSYYHQDEKRPSSLDDTELECQETTLFFSYQAYRAEETAYLFKSTLEKTGPDAIELAAGDCGRITDVFVREPLEESTLSWLGRGVKKFSLDQMSDVIDIVVKEIQFEISHIGVLRLDDHIRNLFDALGCVEQENQTEVIHRLLARVASLDLSAVKVAQLTFCHEAVQRFLTDHDLQRKTFLFPHECMGQKTDCYLANIKSVIAIGYQPYAQAQSVDALPVHLPQRVELAETAQKHAAIRLEARSNFLFKLVDHYFQEMQQLHKAGKFSVVHMEGILECLHSIQKQLKEVPAGQPGFLACNGDINNLELFSRAWLDYNTTIRCCFWQRPSLPVFPVQSCREFSMGREVSIANMEMKR